MLEVRPQHGKNRKRLRPAPEKMPALRRQSRIGDHRAVDSIQRRGLVRDGLRRKKARCQRRRQSGQARHGNKRSREQRERIGEQGRSFQGFEREQRKETREKEISRGFSEKNARPVICCFCIPDGFAGPNEATTASSPHELRVENSSSSFGLVAAKA